MKEQKYVYLIGGWVADDEDIDFICAVESKDKASEIANELCPLWQKRYGKNSGTYYQEILVDNDIDIQSLKQKYSD